MTDFIPYGKQQVTEEDVAAVSETLRSAFLTTGPAVTDFEQAFNSLLGCEHSIAVNSATAGLHVSYLALGLGEGDVLWTSPNTFLSTANAARLCGADVDFVDIDPTTFNMCADKLEEKLKAAEKLPKIVAPVHFAGQVCDMEKIWALAQEYGFYVVEDAAHAVGATYKGEPAANGKYSHAAVLSFHPVKIITTGEGGLITTNSADIAERCRKFRSHGMEKTPEMVQKNGGWYYAMEEVGLNYRLTDIQAALGTSQLSRLDENIARRREIAAGYHEALENLPFGFQKPLEDASSSWHLFVITCQNSAERHALYEYFHRNNVGVQVHYIPVHSQPYYRNLGFKWGDFPNAEAYYERCLSIPMFHGLTQQQQQRVIRLLQQFAQKQKIA